MKKNAVIRALPPSRSGLEFNCAGCDRVLPVSKYAKSQLDQGREQSFTHLTGCQSVTFLDRVKLLHG